ncbi:MAG: hypothetical protein KC635_03970 [Myxococcales bacterium]|nr:hypothetical protein [Myxococcales bacterium]MCB9736519.1 hypothetical protein [Deltaproteobacteria bacterium]
MRPSRFVLSTVLAAVTAVVALTAAGPARANERHFAFTHETATLPRGAVELEPWFTFRTGGEGFYNRYDSRLELELGVAENLQTAFYLNLSADAVEDGGEVVTQVFDPGVSWEWKWKLSDPVADAIGSGLYFELSAYPAELEIELKLLLDKRVGDLLLAFNLVGAVEIEHEVGESETEGEVELDLGIGWALAEDLTLGVELRQTSVVTEGEVEAAALFGGVTLSWQLERAWLVLSVLPQLAGLAGGADGDSLNLTEFERVETRLILGVHL